MSLSESRKDAAERSRAIVLALAEQITTVLRESGATEEESLAALKCAETLAPLLRLESSHSRRYFE